MKILVAYDEFLTEDLFRHVIEEKLARIDDSLEIVSYEVKASDTPQDLPDALDHLTFGNPDDLLGRIDGIEVLLVHKAPVTAEVIEAAKQLRIIGCARGGPGNVDIKAATKHGIPVCHAPGRNANGVAELAIGLMIVEFRHVCRAQNWIRDGKWVTKSPPRDQFLGTELRGKTVGVVGFGSIGSRVAEIAAGFGMRVVVHDPYVDSETITESGAVSMPLDELLRESDIVTLHVRLPEGEKYIIGEREIKLMKESAILINTSDGPVIDEEALFAALDKGRLAGAAQDSWLKKPVTLENRWLKYSSTTVTPGLGGGTVDVPITGIKMIVDGVADYLEGSRPDFVKNPEVLK
jgi:phosphoglycerate dehydrogenase-like enzyme